MNNEWDRILMVGCTHHFLSGLLVSIVGKLAQFNFLVLLSVLPFLSVRVCLSPRSAAPNSSTQRWIDHVCPNCIFSTHSLVNK